MPYTLLNSETTVQVLASDFARDAQRYQAQAHPSEVVYSILIPQTGGWTPEMVAQQLEYWSGIWNQNRLVPGVLGIDVTQEQNQAGQLRDVAIVTVRSSSGIQTSQIVVDVRDWLPDVTGTTLEHSFGDVIAAEVARLDAVEAAG
jgi:hypothetical protein